MSGDRNFGMARLLHLAWPVVLSRAAQAVVGFCDALMVAPLGEDALAAATAGSLNVICMSMLPLGTAFIVQSYAAQMMGKHDVAGTRRFGWYGVLLAVVAGIVYAALIPAIGGLVGRLHYAPNVQGMMTEYIAIRFASIGAVVGIEAIGNWYGGLGNTRYQMAASLLMMVANVILNWMLIEGHWGAPALGVRGAAWASVFATVLGAALMLFLFVFRIGFAGRETLSLRASEFARMLRFGVPNGMNWFLEFSAFMFFINVVVADLGTATTAAMLAVIQVNSVSFMPAFGISSAGAILAGQAIGGGQAHEVGAILRRTLAAAASWQGGVGIVYLTCPAWLMGFFAPAEAGDFVRIGAILLALSAAWQLFDSAGMALSEILRSAGDTTFSLVARILVAWIVFVPLSYLFVTVYDGGAVAAMLAIIGYMALLAFVFWLRFRSGAWRDIRLTG